MIRRAALYERTISNRKWERKKRVWSLAGKLVQAGFFPTQTTLPKIGLQVVLANYTGMRGFRDKPG